VRDLRLSRAKLDDDYSGSISPHEDSLVKRQDIRASAERILYTYLLPGSERELALPATITNKTIEHIECDDRDDPEVFLESKEYVFEFLERDAFPGFLNLSRPLLRVFRRSKSLGPLVNRLSGRNHGN
jgi:Regulator of G protein signaling domain